MKTESPQKDKPTQAPSAPITPVDDAEPTTPVAEAAPAPKLRAVYGPMHDPFTQKQYSQEDATEASGSSWEQSQVDAGKLKAD